MPLPLIATLLLLLVAHTALGGGDQDRAVELFTAAKTATHTDPWPVTAPTAGSDAASAIAITPANTTTPSASRQAAPEFPTYRAVYQASYNGLPIEAHHTLSASANGYRLLTQAKNFLGSISEEERFHLDAKGNILPDHYAYDRSILGKSRSESITVDHETKTVTTQRKGREQHLDFMPGQLGPLSHQMALVRDLRNNTSKLSYQVIHRGEIQEYRYRRLGEEEMNTALGKLLVVKLERVRDTHERETTLWLAPKLDYQLVRLRQKENGETYEMTIKSFKLTSNKP